MRPEDDQLLNEFLKEARDRSRFVDPDHPASIPLIGGSISWKLVIVLGLLAFFLAP